MSLKSHIPNALTIARYVAVPLFVGAWYLPAPYSLWLPIILFALASITDFFDGYLARKWQVESELGRLLDPNADKILVATALIMLCVMDYAHPVVVIAILSRELFISGLREYMAEKQITVHVTTLAKWKTTSQLIAIGLLLWAHVCGCSSTLLVGTALLWLATALTLVTGWNYIRNSWHHLRTG